MMKRQVIALGGGGFSMEPDNLALDRYILSQSGKQEPRICFIPTASGISQIISDVFMRLFIGFRANRVICLCLSRHSSICML
ncbi:Peptidase family S51 [Terribacillus halophilus]|uniref:Peptidase family S51 n=1 Tax=Terribacillus halophilus TaxID=361279 RepID=A0A1G6ULW4_9BACI|nr:Peptidase family S51 [Terribacillus halophilus]